MFLDSLLPGCGPEFSFYLRFDHCLYVSHDLCVFVCVVILNAEMNICVHKSACIYEFIFGLNS